VTLALLFQILTHLFNHYQLIIATNRTNEWNVDNY